MTRAWGATVLISIAALALAACAPTTTGADPTGSSTGDPSPSSTPSATEPAWTVAFDGDCDALLSPEQRETIVAPNMVERTELWEKYTQASQPASVQLPSPGAEGTAGGLRCKWGEDVGNDYEGQWLEVFVFPESLVEASVAGSYAEPTCEAAYGGSSCRLAATAGGAWVLVTMGPDAATTEAPASMTAVRDAVLENLAAAEPPVPATATDQWWPIVDCAALAEDMQLGEVLADYGTGRWEGAPSLEQTILENVGAEQYCEYVADDVANADWFRMSITTAPGGAWLWDRTAVLLPDTVDVEGAEDAVRLTVEGEDETTDVLAATDGTNLIWVTVDGLDVAPEVAARALGTLAASED
ncbi:hypothetical protein [Microbacterium sp. bgisy189]|uniref:hypothetical protein n=1 Tax=Microbacterium sp. bgisy189 TaxID=3413798 RepID=UPI003EBE68F6